jgi:hypothetical protein
LYGFLLDVVKAAFFLAAPIFMELAFALIILAIRAVYVFCVVFKFVMNPFVLLHIADLLAYLVIDLHISQERKKAVHSFYRTNGFNVCFT